MNDAGKWLDRILWALIVLVSGYVGSQLRDATNSINQLNEKMAIVITNISIQNKAIDDHEIRIRTLELSRAKR